MPDELRAQDLISALNSIDPCSLRSKTDSALDEWMQFAVAWKFEEMDYSIFDEWSQRDPARYDSKENRKRWDSIKNNKAKQITGDTIFRRALDGGWKQEHPYRKNDASGGTQKKYVQESTAAETAPGGVHNETAQEIDKAIALLRSSLKGRYINSYVFSEPGDEWNPEYDAVRFLQALFKDGDFMDVHTGAERRERDGKWSPCDNGATLPYENLIRILHKHKMSDALGKLNPEAGAWIKINPMDAVGHNKENVTAYRHALIECDHTPDGELVPLDQQIQLCHELQLPIAAMVYSGNKSVHAIVKIDASSLEEYEERVKFLYDVCTRYGMPVDPANKNANRATRLPGVIRGQHKQFLIETNTGEPSFEAWQKMVLKGMNGIVSLGFAMDHPKAKPPALVQHVLYQGHKLFIAGASKSGKTWLLIDLAVSISEGKKWLGFNCTPGKVLYVNLEVDAPFFEDRFREVCRAKGIQGHPVNIDVKHGRGRYETISSLTDTINSLCEEIHERYAAIIIDPLYKVLEGEENSNTDMAKMALAGDRLVEVTGASLIVCHHFSKGDPSKKRAMDRPAGAGLFSRDNDTQMYITQYDEKSTNGDLVFDVEFTNRNDVTPDNRMIRFVAPVFQIVSPKDYPGASLQPSNGKSQAEWNDVYDRAVAAYPKDKEVQIGNRYGVKKQDLVDAIRAVMPDYDDSSASTVERLITNNSGYKNLGKIGKDSIWGLTSSSPINDDEDM